MTTEDQETQQVTKKVVSGVAWLSFFKIISQAFSWGTTIVVTRILTAQDYGLMEMATVFTGYIEFLVEFGISAAIINRKTLKQSETSTIFWFLLFWGIVLGLSCMLIAPITAWYFQNEELKNLTATVGILFVLSSLIILPRSLLHRDFRFKEIGSIDAFSIICACLFMIILANNGAGVWTLVLGSIFKGFVQLICLYMRVTFKPTFYFSISELLPILRYGAPVLASNSLFYAYNKADRIFGGRFLGGTQLGFYAMALQLAAMPIEKILSIFQSAIFPAFSKLKDDQKSFNELFLKFTNVTYSLILPIFIGGVLVADNLIPLLLGEKWRSAVIPFQLLSISQIFVAIGSPLSIIHVGRGKPGWSLTANLILTPLMFVSFYYSSQFDSIATLAVPWVTVYPVFVLFYLLATLRVIRVTILSYVSSIFHPCAGTLIMVFSFYFAKSFLSTDSPQTIQMLAEILTCVAVYTIYSYLFNQDVFRSLKSIK